MDYKISTAWAVTLVIAAIWELAWRIPALWRAARKGQTTWFVLLLVINSVGILPIIYLFLSREGKRDDNA